MILIKVNNRGAQSNFALMDKIHEWAKQNIQGEFCIMLSPNVEGEVQILNTGTCSEQDLKSHLKIK